MQDTPIHFGPRQFGCPYCALVMRASRDLKRHILIHTGEKPFSCQHCEYSANRKTHLDLHMKSQHRGLLLRAEWKLDWNRILFFLRPNLIPTFPCLQKAPMRLGPKQFGCQICSMIFKTNYNAKRHLMIHTGEKPFNCQYCNYSTNQNSVLRSHMKNNHKQTAEF